MKNTRLRSAQNKGGCRRQNSFDFISQMPEDLLLMILCLLPIKDAVVTSSLSKNWRFLWCKLIQLNFDGTQPFDNKVNLDWGVFYSEEDKYINQVNSIIQSYNRPMVQDFRIRYGLKDGREGVIDEWLQFAVNKKVEFLELDLCQGFTWYDFPFRLFERRSNATVVSLKKLILKNVILREAILQELLTNSPHLETISIHDSSSLTHIRVGGQALNLKHFEIKECYVQSIYLSDFGLLSFTYKGSPIDLRLDNLPKLKEVELDMRPFNMRPRYLNNKVLGQISSCALSLQSLSINIYPPKICLMLDSVPELPNVKKLRLMISINKDNGLLDLASIVNACPNMESFAIKPLWTSPFISRRKAMDVTNPHERLKLVEIVGYDGGICDFELVAYIMHTSVALKKIVIHTRFQDEMQRATAKAFSKRGKAARSSAEHQLVPILPRGVELVIL